VAGSLVLLFQSFVNNSQAHNQFLLRNHRQGNDAQTTNLHNKGQTRNQHGGELYLQIRDDFKFAIC